MKKYYKYVFVTAMLLLAFGLITYGQSPSPPLPGGGGGAPTGGGGPVGGGAPVGGGVFMLIGMAASYVSYKFLNFRKHYKKIAE